MAKSDLFVIRRYMHEIPAEMACALLKEAGIQASVLKDDCGGMRPHLQLTSGVRLVVNPEDAAKAEEILSAMENQADMEWNEME